MKRFSDYIFEKELKTKANIVRSWAKKYGINEEDLIKFWKRAICAVIEDGKHGKCEPENWGIVVDIFKEEVRKHYGIKDITLPVIKGKKVHIHPDNETIRQTLLRYDKEIKECCSNCPKVCKE